jgi:hypothetical protein
MPTFLTIGYGHEDGYQATSAAVREQAHTHDAWLVRQGAMVGRAGAPTQVRNPEGTGVRSTTGAFLRSDLPVAGFAVFEAESLDDAIARVAGTPCAVAHGVVEVWPLLR